MSSWPDGVNSSKYDAPEVAPVIAYPAAQTVSASRTTAGSLFLYLAVLFVVGISVGALMGVIDPVAGAVIVLGAEVVGTIAFFLTYYIGRGLGE